MAFSFWRRWCYNCFLKHPQENCMTFKKHTIVSANLSIIFFNYGFKALIHSVVPCLYPTSSTEAVDAIQKILNENGCQNIKKKS